MKKNVKEIRSRAEFDKLVLGMKRPVVLDVMTCWCQPCQELAPVLEKLALALKGKIIFRTIDVADDHKWLCSRYRVQAFPTLLLFVDGKQRKRIVGPDTKDEILEWLGEV